VLQQPRRRWAFFPRSVISDHENPSAHLYRAMARVVSERDDEARFYEERANPWLRNMLLAEGATAFRTFQHRHPHVTYVTYEPRTGHRLAEWLGLALGTVDIVVVDSAAPETIVRWIGELTRPKLQTFLLDPDGHLIQSQSVPEFVQFYGGLCVTTPVADTLDESTQSKTITFGPSLPTPGTNGSASRHIDETAEQLVSQLISTVDETRRQYAQLSGDMSRPEEPDPS
jgi:hypothetical protein